MKNSAFRHIQLHGQFAGDLLTPEALKFSSQATQPNVAEIFDDVANLAECALSIFRGIYPAESPFFVWGETMPLPWIDSYWTERFDRFIPASIEAEVLIVLDELKAASPRTGPAVFPANTYLSEYLSTDLRLKIQGLVVEALLSIDEFLELVINGQHLEAMPWLSAAFKFQIEIVHYAWPAVDRSQKARSAANARHGKFGQARRFVMEEWLQHKLAYNGNKSAFARDYVRRLKHEFDVGVTEKTIREVWLIRTPPGDLQAYQSEGG